MLTTKRLHIRAVHLDDAPRMFEYRSVPEIAQYLSMTPQCVQDMEQIILQTARDIDIPDTWFQLVIIEKSSEQIIGDIGIHFLPNDNMQVEIGYTLDKNFHKKGYATEGVSKVIDFIFNTLNKHRITASIDPGNKNSLQLVKRLGFRKEAHFVKSLYFKGQWVDDIIYAMLSEEWEAKEKDPD